MRLRLLPLLLAAVASRAVAVDLNLITAVELKDEGTDVVLSVKGTKKPNFTTFSMADPPRFVIDFSESKFEGVPDQLKGSGVVQVVKNQSYGADATSIARVMIAFTAEVDPPTVEDAGDRLVVRIAKGAGGGEAPAVAAASASGVDTTATLKADAKAALDADAKAKQEAAAVAAAAAAKADADAQAKADADAKVKAEADEAARQQAVRDQLAADEKGKAAAAAAATAAAATAKADADAKAKADADAKAKARADAEAQAQADAKARADADAKAKADAAAVATAAAAASAAKAEADAKGKTKSSPVAAAAAAAAAPRAPEQDADQAELDAEIAAAKSAQDAGAAQPAQVEKLAPVAPGAPSRLREVGFKQLPTASRVFVRTTSTPQVTVQDVDDRTIRIEFANVRVTRRNDTRLLDTSFFASAVQSVKPSREGGNYVLEVKLRERVPYEQKVEGDMLAIDFQRPASTATRAPPAGSKAPGAAPAADEGEAEETP